MITEYTETDFDVDKEEMLQWLNTHWTWDNPYQVFLSNILRNLRNWIEAIERDG